MGFYDQFARQNAAAPRAAVQTAQAYHRVGLLQVALGDSRRRGGLRRGNRAVRATDGGSTETRRPWRDLSRVCSQAVQVSSSPERGQALLKKALDAASKAIDLLPKQADLYVLRSQIRVQLSRDVSEVIHDLKAAVALNGNDPLLHESLAWILCNSPPYTERRLALSHAKRAIELDPENPDHHACAGRIATLLGDSTEGMKYLSKAIELDPDKPMTRLIRARSYADIGSSELAYADLLKLWKARFPENPMRSGLELRRISGSATSKKRSMTC